AGVAPGLTNLLVKRAADMLDELHSVRVRLYESTESEDPISQWSPEVSFDEAVSHPRVYRKGKFQLAKRFSEIEPFRFLEPIGTRRVVLAAQDEVATLPYFIPMQDLDVKIGGNEIDRLRRWHKQGKLSRSRGMARQRFPQTFSPKRIAKLIRQGILQVAVGAGIAAITNHMAFSGSPRWMAIAPSALAPRSATLDQARMDTLHCAAGSPRRQGKGKRRPAASYARVAIASIGEKAHGLRPSCEKQIPCSAEPLGARKRGPSPG